jgi:mRNA interferase RelE/StbE
MDLIFTRSADKSLGKMPRHDATALLAKLKIFAVAPFMSHSFAKALTGGGVRIRHGDWRAVCDVDGGRLIVLVVEIGNRREIYR